MRPPSRGWKSLQVYKNAENVVVDSTLMFNLSDSKMHNNKEKFDILK